MTALPLRVVSGIGMLALLTGCGGSTSREPTTVTVLAAASLTEAFTSLAAAYEAEHDGVTIALSFGSSTTLAQQIAEGADADLYASAGRAALAHLPQDDGGDGGEQLIARNVLEIAVPPGNPAGVTGLADFTREDIDTVLCAETVPCGTAADEAFDKARLTPTPASRELDVKATLAKVTLGEADAAIVYRSDVVSAAGIEEGIDGADGAGDAGDVRERVEGVEGVEIPESENVVMDYPLVWFNADPHTTGFAELLSSEQGQEALTAAGFTIP